ncbi:MAG: hypothetical protein ACR2RA_21220, partial [Geminicoccaceae bacterium]
MRVPNTILGWLAGLFIALSSPALAAAPTDIEPLVDVAWVKANSEREDVVILDIRNQIDGGSPKTFA